MTCAAKYFLAANSAEGFFSEFGNCYDPFDGWMAYIIKGGPGTGKSSFMKKVLTAAAEKGETAEIVYCTGDPDSLDAVIFPKLKKIIMDGTAPHVVDPLLPGVGDKILNFGEFWDEEKFNQPELMKRSFKENKALHKTAAKYICAAGRLQEAILSHVNGKNNEVSCEDYAKMIADKFLPKIDGKGSGKVRFLGGVTPKGVKYFTESVINLSKNTIVINDKYGTASDIIMKTVNNTAIKRGYDVVSYKNPLLPLQLLDAIEIPSVSLLVIREYCLNKCENVADKMFAEQFYKAFDASGYGADERVLKELLGLASGTLNKAKQVHDEMEKHYIAAMNFDKLQAFADTFCEQFF